MPAARNVRAGTNMPYIDTYYMYCNGNESRLLDCFAGKGLAVTGYVSPTDQWHTAGVICSSGEPACVFVCRFK
jgi:hypothetical protein